MLKNKYLLILIIIIAIGFLLRLVGFQFEYLFNSIADESYHNSCVLRMLQNKTFSHSGCQSPYPILYTFFYVPSIIAGLFTLLLKHGFDLDVLKQVIAVYPFSTMPFIRIFTIIIGTAQIFLIYKITKTLFNSQLKGLIAAGFMAFSLLPVQLSHWGRAWTLLFFFNLLSLYSTIWIYRTGRIKYYILNAIFTSSAVGVHYLGFFGAIFVFCGYFFRRIKKLPVINKNLYLSFALAVFFSALWLFLNRAGVHDMYLAQTFRGIKYISSNILFLKIFAFYDPVVFLLFAIALFILFINFRKLLTFEHLFLIVFFFFYLGGMILFNFGPRIRWTLPLIVIAIPIAADLVGNLRIKIKSQTAYALLIIFLFLPSLFFSAAWDYILTLPNTRFTAKDWIENNLPPDSKILFLDETSVLAVSQDGAKDLNKALTGVRPPNARYLYLAEKGQSAFPGYRVVNLRQFLDNPSFFQNEPFDYYILSYKNEKERREQITFVPKFDNLELVHEIMPFSRKGQESFEPEKDFPLEYLNILKDIRSTGPSIEIYRKTI